MASFGGKRAGGDGGAGGGKRNRTADDDEIDHMIDMDVDAEHAEAEAEMDDMEAMMSAPPESGDAPTLDDCYGRNWPRPPVEAAAAAGAEPLVFQQLEIDQVFAYAHPRYHPQGQGQSVPVLRVYGVNRKGNSVCAFVHGFEPYLYADMPSGLRENDVDLVRQALDAKLHESQRRSEAGPCVRSASIVRKKNLWGYSRGESYPFVKIVTRLPSFVGQARKILENGLSVPGIGTLHFKTFESNVLFILRFMIDCNIVGGNWLELPKGAYSVRSGTSKLSYAQIEVDVRFDSVISHPSEGPFMELAPLRILSIDIECAGRKGHFPEADKDPVIQIANVLTVQGESEPRVRNVMTLGTCAPIVGSEVSTFTTADGEAAMLRYWADFLRKTDPDVIIGYNILKFDLPYLIDRAKKLKVNEFRYLGRIRSSPVKVRDTVFSSRAYGTRESKEITMDGRIQFDLFTVIQRDHKLSSYSLNNVSATFLGEQKEDVHHSCISDLFHGNEETRRRLAVYCLKDALLPQRLLDKLMYMYNYVEMARVTGVPLNMLLTRGQSIKVFSQILRKARQKNLVVPALKGGGQQDGVAFEGATVLEANQGYYKDPVATLDFASLYPSIMMAHNLCYSTLLSHNMIPMMNPEDYTKTPSGQYFAKSSLCKGILPEILEELLGARKRAKKDLKNAKDEFLKGVLNGRQLALKVSANSVYGFTGATVGKMPCLEISASVTAFGRDMIVHTKDLVTKTYCKANGYAYDSEVVYGDTDSVMIKFGTPSLAESMKLGEEAAAFVSETFVKPIKLEFEKVYYPYLLISKKRYAGVLWTNPDSYDKMDTKGIETVRRDNCLLVRDLVTTSLQKMLIEKDVEGAKAYVKQKVSDLLMNRLDMSHLVVTKELTQQAEKYDNRQAHAELAQKLRKRDPSTAPQLGDRIPFVIIKGAKGMKAYEKAEDPIYALEHNLPIDCQHYLEHHLKLPLMRIFEPVLKNPNELFVGEHTRSIKNPTPTMAMGGIMKFAQVTQKCLGCKTPIRGSNAGNLCANCKSNEAAIYLKTLDKVNLLEDQYSRLWTQCQRCSGNLHQDVLCTARDCPIFYRRKKVQIDLANETKAVRSFAW